MLCDPTWGLPRLRGAYHVYRRVDECIRYGDVNLQHDDFNRVDKYSGTKPDRIASRQRRVMANLRDAFNHDLMAITQGVPNMQ